MQKKKCTSWNYLLIHLRQTSGLTIRMVCQQTAIPGSEYCRMESGALISEHDAELLGALFGLQPYFLKNYSLQLQFLTGTHHMLHAKNKKIGQLTKALKRKITRTKHSKKEINEKE